MFNFMENLLAMLKKLTEIKPNKFNQVVYGKEKLSEDFVEDIRKHGVLVPVSIKRDGTLISGHKRVEACLHLKLKTIPANVVFYGNVNDEREAIISYNNQREKTFRQRMNEAQQLQIIERERAKERMKAGKKLGGRLKNAQG